MKTTFQLLVLFAVLTCNGVVAQVSGTIPPPNSKLKTPTPSAAASPGVHPESVAGTVEGFVYWDANAIHHSPANDCSGLAVTVSVGSNSGGPLTAYTPLSTLSNNFKYVGQVKAFLAGGKIIVYDVCTYGYDKLPVGLPLQVTLTVAQPAAFSPIAAPQFSVNGPITIINGKCNMLPRIVNPTFSDLGTHWGSCQNMAYDVNFALQTTAGGSTGASATKPNPALVQSTSAPANAGMRDPGPVQTPMLSGTSQEGMLAGNPGPIQLPSGNARAQHDVAPATAASNPQTYTGPTRNTQAGVLTNSDVVRMLESGLTESVIVSAIRSSRKNFDFSPAGCQTLQRARVSVSVLTAMADGSVRRCEEKNLTSPSLTPGSNAGLTSQSGPPGSKEAPASRAALKPIKLAAPKASRKVTNPRLAEQNAGIIAVLQQQREAAQNEATAMKLAMRCTSMARTTTLQGNPKVQTLGPETTQSETKNFTSQISHVSSFNSLPLTCTHDATPRIIQLSGGEGHGIFTPEAKYNLYTITGCSFGSPDPGNSAYIFGVNGFKASLNIDFWSDNGITAHLDPWLAGVLDQDNITLVVAPAGKQSFNMSGYKFYAARGMPGPGNSDLEVAIAYDSMPRASVTLFDPNPVLTGYDQVPSNASSQFPSFSFQGTPVASWVFRYADGHVDGYPGLTGVNCFVNDVGYPNTYPVPVQCASYFDRSLKLGSDLWDFGKLAPGFLISSYNLYYVDTDATQLCGSWDDYRKDSGRLLNWDFNLTAPTQITVTWPLYWCEDIELPPSGRSNQQTQSAYGLAVWLLGPRCVDPWTGQKDQSCMNQVKQILG